MSSKSVKYLPGDQVRHVRYSTVFEVVGTIDTRPGREQLYSIRYLTDDVRQAGELTWAKGSELISNDRQMDD